MLYNKNNLSVAKIASVNALKPELASVLFTKTHTAATDGFRLLEMSVDASANIEDYPQANGVSAMRGFKPFLVNAKALAEVKPPTKTSLPILQYVAIKHVDQTRVEFVSMTGDMEAHVSTVRRVEGEFPNYEPLFPAGEPVASVRVNGVYLAELAKLMGDMLKLQVLDIEFYGAGKPLVLHAESEHGRQKSRALLMPIRI